MTTMLALFDLDALTPGEPTQCHCGQAPATQVVVSVPNLLISHNGDYGTSTHRAPARRPACDWCSWRLACSYWDGTFVCPTGRCVMWAHTWDQPAYACTRHHREHTVVWREPLPAAGAVRAA